VFRYREEGGYGTGMNRRNHWRPSHRPQNRRELELDAISECSGTHHRIIEGMKTASENGDFDLTKVRWTSLASWIAPRNEVKWWIDISPVCGQICEMDKVMNFEIYYV
jgi:hypothetical protein